MAHPRNKVLRRGRIVRGASKVRHSHIADKVLLQPWFLPQRIAFAIHDLVPHSYWNKMRYFFDDYGCMICGRDFEYHSNGMCRSCCQKISKKLAQSVKRHSKARLSPRVDIVLIRQESLAKRLLRRFTPAPRPTLQRQTINLNRRCNPVYELLCAHRG